MSVPARETDMTKTQRLMDDIIGRIRSGELRPGDRLPSARELREIHQVSQMTVRMAMERLRSAGWVVTAPGAGVWVSASPPESGVTPGSGV